jgi:MFS transporter, ACS family, glucarate transporter
VPVAGRKIPVRWWIFAFLLGFTFAAYIQRQAVSVAAARMMPELGLTQDQIGWLETAFLISYTALQFPGGVLGQRLGPRLMLALCGLIAVCATAAVPLLPSSLAGNGLFAALLAAQCVLGAMQAPVFALVAGGLERWFPSRQWALTQGLTTCGVGLGAAAAPALIASLMVVLGWRSALLLVALPVLALVVLWWWQGRDTPYEHPAVTARELADLDHTETTLRSVTWARMARLLGNRNLLGLTFSYLLMNVVFYLITFWSFLYLVQARHFSELNGGLSAALPPLAGALGAAAGGFAGSHCTARFGARRGLRIVPLITLPLAGILLLSVQAESAVWALTGLSLSFGVLEMNEACFWAASMEIGREDAAAAGAILNTGGNLGGILATPVVAHLSGQGNWLAPFAAGAVCAGLSAALWLVIAAEPREVRPWALPLHPTGAGGPRPRFL